jgi:hypothetical protein
MPPDEAGISFVAQLRRTGLPMLGASSLGVPVSAVVDESEDPLPGKDPELDPLGGPRP